MSTPSPRRDITQLMQAAGTADREAADQLFALIYEQLRKIAQRRMTGERAEHTLQATALVNEAYLRLVGDTQTQWQGRVHFFAAAAEAMRRILIDHARRRGTTKRGAGLKAIGGVLDLASEDRISDALALDELVSRLEASDSQAAQVVRLRFFAGLSIEEAAEALGVSPRTVKRDWEYARAWLADAWSRESS